MAPHLPPPANYDVQPGPGPRESKHSHTHVDGTGDRIWRPMLCFRPIQSDGRGFGPARLLMDAHMLTGQRADVRDAVRGLLAYLLREMPPNPFGAAVAWLENTSLLDASKAINFPREKEDWRKRHDYNAYLFKYNLQVVFQEMLLELFESKAYAPMEFMLDFLRRKEFESK